VSCDSRCDWQRLDTPGFTSQMASRHCEPTGPREARPDDRLREAIHLSTRGDMDCFVASLLALTSFRVSRGLSLPALLQ
jgi:hypothetical protein